MIWLPDTRTLLAGDTLEDTVTYVAEAEHFDRHLGRPRPAAALDPAFILPNHGDPGIIAAGGYGKSLIPATQVYVRKLMRAAREPDLRSLTLREFVAPLIADGSVTYFEPYEAVHKGNIASMLAVDG